jgi:hypothetical protein
MTISIGGVAGSRPPKGTSTTRSEKGTYLLGFGLLCT